MPGRVAGRPLVGGLATADQRGFDVELEQAELRARRERPRGGDEVAPRQRRRPSGRGPAVRPGSGSRRPGGGGARSGRPARGRRASRRWRTCTGGRRRCRRTRGGCAAPRRRGRSPGMPGRCRRGEGGRLRGPRRARGRRLRSPPSSHQAAPRKVRRMGSSQALRWTLWHAKNQDRPAGLESRAVAASRWSSAM